MSRYVPKRLQRFKGPQIYTERFRDAQCNNSDIQVITHELIATSVEDLKPSKLAGMTFFSRAHLLFKFPKLN